MCVEHLNSCKTSIFFLATLHVGAGDCGMIAGPRSMKLPHSWHTGSDQPSAPAICHAWQPAISHEPENPFIFIWHFMDMQRAKPRTLLRLCIWISFPRIVSDLFTGYFIMILVVILFFDMYSLLGSLRTSF